MYLVINLFPILINSLFYAGTLFWSYMTVLGNNIAYW